MYYCHVVFKKTASASTGGGGASKPAPKKDPPKPSGGGFNPSDILNAKLGAARKKQAPPEDLPPPPPPPQPQPQASPKTTEPEHYLELGNVLVYIQRIVVVIW